MGPLAKNIVEHYTYGDYLTWNDDERWELIEGIPFNMTPAPRRTHQKIAGEIFLQLATFLKGKPCEVYIAPFDVRLPLADEANNEITTVVQPDIVVICDKAKLDDAGCKGAPDLIIEILSPATARKDLKEKFALYENRGVREYWLVDPEAKTVMAFHLDQAGSYGRPTIYAIEDKIEVAVLSGLVVDLEAIFS